MFSYNLQHVLIWDIIFVVLGLLLNIMHLLSILRLAWFWRGVHISELCQILLPDKYSQIQAFIECLLHPVMLHLQLPIHLLPYSLIFVTTRIDVFCTLNNHIQLISTISWLKELGQKIGMGVQCQEFVWIILHLFCIVTELTIERRVSVPNHSNLLKISQTWSTLPK